MYAHDETKSKTKKLLAKGAKSAKVREAKRKHDSDESGVAGERSVRVQQSSRMFSRSTQRRGGPEQSERVNWTA
jgi:hypothetical protein